MEVIAAGDLSGLKGANRTDVGIGSGLRNRSDTVVLRGCRRRRGGHDGVMRWGLTMETSETVRPGRLTGSLTREATETLDLLIRGGEVVTPQGVGKWSVGVQGEKIAFIGTDEHAPQAGRTIDAGGKIVVPGGIEPHAHLDITISPTPSWRSTLGPEQDTGEWLGGNHDASGFLLIEPRMELPKRSRRGWRDGREIICRLLISRGAAGSASAQRIDQIGDVIKQGFPSFKIFTTDVMPPHPKRARFRLDMGRIQLAMEKVAKNDGIMVVHAEDDDMVQFNYEKFAAEGSTQGSNMNQVHTKLSEGLAFDRVIRVAR